MSARDKWVRRFSVDETSKHKNGFTIYKITSVLFPIDSPEVLTVVSVWKRYSDVQRLHKSMRALHAGLHLRGAFPTLPRYSYFKRFQQEVISERAKTIKMLLEFIAEHNMLFTSTDFVNFLQTGYPEPAPSGGGVINAIRSSLHLPIEESPPLEYHTSDDDSRSPAHSAHPQNQTRDEQDFSGIPIYEAANVEMPTPKPSNQISQADSFESLSSLESNSEDFYKELDKLKIEAKSKPSVKKSVLPDLINFDAPSTSFEDYHTIPSHSETVSLNSTIDSSCDDRQVNSRVSSYKSSLSLSNVECKTKTEDSYVFEAGYMLNLATRYEDMREFQRAFECYKAGIEKMLIGVQSDADPQRRALIKEKTNRYLSYAEAIYKNHLCDAEQSLLPERPDNARAVHCPVPLSMLSRPYEELSQYRVLAVLGASVMLVLHGAEQTCYAMKVIQKVPNNLTEFDEYFLQNTNETRQPILPTLIPYMVQLHSYIQTNNLIFLILSYAPGEKLFDYIKNYAKSLPTTPAREVNLENVFSKPKVKKTDIENDNLDSIIEIKHRNIGESKKFDQNSKLDETTSIIDCIEANRENNNKEIKTETLENMESTDMSVKELVKNSQKLLHNVDKALSDEPKDRVEKNEEATVNIGETNVEEIERRVETPSYNRTSPGARVAIPPSAVCRWGAEILTALESLHNSGVVCRDLKPTNILLGARGQVILTYFTYYPGLDMSLSALRGAPPPPGGAHMAPELHRRVHLQETEEMERVCDYWSFGAVMYQLICGVPLSHYHRSVFTSHTVLMLPDGLSLEADSLLTQLLTYEPSERLGAGRDGIEEIKRHPYFKHIDWREVYDSWVVPG